MTKFIDLDALPNYLAELISKSDSNPEEQIYHSRSQKQVRKFIESLPDDMREIVLSHFEDQLSYKAIAERVEKTPEAIKQTIKRFRAKLRAAQPDQAGVFASDRVEYTRSPAKRYHAHTDNRYDLTLQYSPHSLATGKPVECWYYAGEERVSVMGKAAVDRMLAMLSDMGMDGKTICAKKGPHIFKEGRLHKGKLRPMQEDGFVLTDHFRFDKHDGQVDVYARHKDRDVFLITHDDILNELSDEPWVADWYLKFLSVVILRRCSKLAGDWVEADDQRCGIESDFIALTA